MKPEIRKVKQGWDLTLFSDAQGSLGITVAEDATLKEWGHALMVLSENLIRR